MKVSQKPKYFAIPACTGMTEQGAFYGFIFYKTVTILYWDQNI